MLSENIKALRKAKGLSQEDLAIQLNVVRQTISKWEQGLSVPDAEMLITLSEALETPVSTLLGETVAAPQADDLSTIAQRLEALNAQLAQRKAAARKALHWFFLLLCLAIAAAAVVLIRLKSPYLGWDYDDPETAIAGTAFHAFEWLFFRLAPVAFAGAAAGAVLTRKKD